MLDNVKNRIEELSTEGYDFPAASYLSQGWDIYKQQPFSFIGFLIIAFLITIVVSLIPLVGTIANSLIFGPVLGVGYYIVANKIRVNRFEDFGDFFKGFNKVGPLALAALTMSVIILIALSPTIYSVYSSGVVEWYMEVLQNPFETPPLEDLEGMFTSTDVWIFALNLIPVIYLAVAYSFAYMFIVFYDLDFWDAVESSRRVITRQWFSVFGMYALIFLMFIGAGLVLALMAVIPVLGFIMIFFGGVAMLLISPFISCSVYAAFAGTMKLEETTAEEDDILDHLVE